MNYRNLGRSGLKVSEIALGSWTTYGGSVGVVVGFNGSLVRLATEKGAVMARTLDVLAVGDRVLIRQGVAMKSPAAKNVFPV